MTKIDIFVVILNFSAAVAALIAAFLWYRSAIVKVPYNAEPDSSGWTSAAIIVDENTDFISTAAAQSKRSKCAAVAAAVAAALQGISLLLQGFPI